MTEPLTPLRNNTQWIEQGPVVPAPADPVKDAEGASTGEAVGFAVLAGCLLIAFGGLVVAQVTIWLHRHAFAVILVVACIAAGVVASQIKHLLQVQR